MHKTPQIYICQNKNGKCVTFITTQYFVIVSLLSILRKYNTPCHCKATCENVNGNKYVCIVL